MHDEVLNATFLATEGLELFNGISLRVTLPFAISSLLPNHQHLLTSCSLSAVLASHFVQMVVRRCFASTPPTKLVGASYLKSRPIIQFLGHKWYVCQPGISSTPSKRSSFLPEKASRLEYSQTPFPSPLSSHPTGLSMQLDSHL